MLPIPRGRTDRLRILGTALLAAGMAIATAGLLYLGHAASTATAADSPAQTETARSAREMAETVATLCATRPLTGRDLAAAGLCDQARETLAATEHLRPRTPIS